MARRNSRRWATPSRYPRTARVNEVLREVIAGELERRASDDPRLDLVTITGIDVDSDFHQAKVYFSALGTSASHDQVVAALEERRARLQGAVARGVRLKRTPQLVFVPDPGIIEGQRVEQILHRIREEGGPEGPDEVRPAGSEDA